MLTSIQKTISFGKSKRV